MVASPTGLSPSYLNNRAVPWSITWDQYWHMPSGNVLLPKTTKYTDQRDPLYSVPRAPDRLVDYTWTQRFNLTNPTYQHDWPNPQPIVWYQSWTYSFPQGILAKPFNQSDWPNPRTYVPIDQFWEQEPLPILFGQDKQFRDSGQWMTWDYPNPQPITWYQTWVENLLQSTLAPVTNNPFFQTDWPLPKTYQPIDQFWVNSLNILPRPTPFIPFDWPNPPRIVWDRFWSQGLPFGSLQTPFVQSDWPNPEPINWYQWWFSNQPFGSTQRPTSQLDWPTPQPIQWYRDFYQALAPYFPSVFPFEQTDWQNPKTWQPIDQWWFNNLISLLTAVAAPLPFNQFDWPVPKTTQPIDPTWSQALVLNLPEPPAPIQQDLGGKTWTREEWTKKLSEYTRTHMNSSAVHLGRLGGIASGISRRKR